MSDSSNNKTALKPPKGWENGAPKSFRSRNDHKKCGFPPNVTLQLEKQHGLKETHFVDLVWPKKIDK